MSISQKHDLMLRVFHVKSHLDDDVDYEELPWEAQLNIDCDQLAALTRSCSLCNKKPSKYLRPPSHGASLQIGKT